MLPMPSGVLAEATSTQIKKFSFILILNLYYTPITYNEQKSVKQRAKINE